MTRIGAVTATTFVVLAASLLAPAPAQAVPGDLDPTFSGDGRQTTDLGTWDWGRAVAIQGDGKIVVAGGASDSGGSTDDFAVARYTADGTLDTSFSGDGTVRTDFGRGESGEAVAIQGDGKIVVAGSTGDGLGGYDFALARYTAAGALDTSFSDDGTATTDLGGFDYGRAVAIQGDGRIVVAGSTGDNFALVRYHPDGSLDSSFGAGGNQTTDFGGSDFGAGVAIQADDRIVAAGSSIPGADGDFGDFALARYDTNGSLDTSFGAVGKQTSDFDVEDSGEDVAIRGDGKIVVAGKSSPDFTLGRGDFALASYNLDGSPDTGFSDDGWQTTDFGGVEVDDAVSGVAIQADGKIVAVGTTSGPDEGSDFALARYEGEPPSDSDPPETAITGGPMGTSSDSTPTFTFSSSESGSTFECRIDGGAFSPCSSPHTTAPLSGGSHSFDVRATDGAGNTDPTPASQTWTIVSYQEAVLGTTGLVSYWRLGERSGATAADARGANQGRYRSGVALGQPSALLHDANPSAGFDGSNDYIDVADHASLDTGDTFSLEAWVKRSSTSPSTKTVLSKGTGSWRLSFVNNVLTLTKSGFGTVATASVSTTDTTGFHHVVATKSGATVRLYIDGDNQTGTVTNRTIANTSTPLNIGRHTAGSEYFPGLIDEVAIYNTALNADQVQQHFNGSGR